MCGLPAPEPPLRAEHIGSLLRPKELLEARGQFARGEITQAELTAAEDTAIKGAIALQKQLGLRFVTDGEFRRRSYHSFFYRQLGDITIDVVGGEPISGADGNESGKRGAQPLALIKSRVQWTHPINVDDYKFLAANIAASGSTAVVSAPTATRAAVSLPVPAPRSSTRGPGAKPSAQSTAAGA